MGKRVASAPDRRVIKTREGLYAALVSQILSKGYDAVTVQDVLDEANVGRSTFYGHFPGKEALLRYGFERLRSELEMEQLRLEAVDPTSGDFSFAVHLLRHAKAHLPLYKAMLGARGGLVAQQQLKSVVSDLIRRELDGQLFDPEIPREFLLEFLVGAFLSVLQHWLDKKRSLDPMTACTAYRRIAWEGLKALKADPGT